MMVAKERGQWDSKKEEGETGFMKLVSITTTGRAEVEKRNVLFVYALTVNAPRSHIPLFLDGSSAGKSAYDSARNVSTARIIPTTGLKLVAGTGVARTTSGLMRSSVEIKRRAGIAVLAISNCTPITLNRTGIFLSRDLMWKMASRFVSDVIGIPILHKMKTRLIRWIPQQVKLWAIPSQASGETCLKV